MPRKHVTYRYIPQGSSGADFAIRPSMWRNAGPGGFSGPSSGCSVSGGHMGREDLPYYQQRRPGFAPESADAHV
jgi:hypothetical protein